MKLSYKEYTLNEAAVDAVSADVQDYLKTLNTESRSLQRIRLTVEEILLNLLDHGESRMTISVGLGRQFCRHVFRLRYEGEAFNPIKSSENLFRDDLLRSLGLFPAWSCRGNTNTVSLVLANRANRSTLFYILIAVLAAVILGLLGKLIPDNLRLSLCNSLLAPMAEGFLGLLSTFAGMMIFLTICSGILGMGDSATLGRVGKSIIARFVGFSFVISGVALVLSLPFVNYNYTGGGQADGSVFDQISRMFFDILPKNLIDPFRTGNTFHIIVLAAFVGGALLAIGERGNKIRELINEASNLFQQILATVCSLVPLFVFAMLLKLIWSGQEGILLSVLKPLIMIHLFVVLFVVAFWLISSLRLKCPPMLLLKKVLPPFLVAFTTASSMSAFQLGMETCEKKLGIKKSLTAFAYPLGSVVFMPSSVVYFTLLSCSLAGIYQIPVGIPWFIMTVVIATLVTIAMPPIPGADMLCLSVLFSGLGIPAEAIILATAIGVILDYLDTGSNVMLMILETACEAKRLGEMDEKILMRKE